MSEIWKFIEGFEDYQVSNLGNVRSCKKGKIKMIKPTLRFPQVNVQTPEKYLGVTLSQNGNRKCFSVHQLVAKAFIPNPKNLPQVNHKNGIKDDNRVENLERCTIQENVLHRFYELGKNLHYEGVRQYDKNGNFIAEYKTIREASIENNITYGNIIRCAKGERNVAGGYVWRFISDKNSNVKYDNKVKKPVVQLSASGEYIKTFNSIVDAAKKINASANSIARCCSQLDVNKVCGYIWRFLDNYDVNEFSIFKGKKILEYTTKDVFIKEHNNIHSLIKETGYDLIKILKTIKGEQLTAYRRKWKIY